MIDLAIPSDFFTRTYSAQFDWVSIVFHYNQVSPNVHGRHSNTAERSMTQLVCEINKGGH